MNSLFNLKIPIKKINIELPKSQLYSNLTQEEKDLASSIHKTLNERLYVWDTSVIEKQSKNNSGKNNDSSARSDPELNQKPDFNFNLPESKFTKEALKINFTDHTKCPVIYHKSEKSLNEEHLKEIVEDGSFKVRSNIRDFPYKFQISKFVITGKNRVFKNFNDDLGMAFDWFYDTKNRLGSEHFFGVSLKNGYDNLKEGMVKIIDIIVGLKGFDLRQEKKLIRTKDLPKEFLLHLKKNFAASQSENKQTEISEDNTNAVNEPNRNKNNNSKNNIDLDLSIYSKEFRKKYASLRSDFEKEWNQNESNSKEKIYKANPSLNEEQVVELFRDKYIQKFFSYIRENKDKLEGKENLIIEYVKAFRVFHDIDQEYKSKLDDLRSTTLEVIKDKHKIKSKSDQWLEEKLKTEIAGQERALKKEKLSRLENELKNYPQAMFVFLNYLSFMRQSSFEDDFDADYLVDKILKLKKQRGLLTIPKKEFVLLWKLKAPYEVLKKDTHYYDSAENKQNTVSYSLKKYEEIKIDSTKNFWKLRYFMKSYLTTTNNIYRNCLDYAWNSSYGLQALYKKELELEDRIDSETGEITKRTSNKTYRGQLARLVSEIKLNRLEFEKRKATGLFGKGVERIFNLGYNYIYKGLGHGFVYGVAYPTAIIGMSTVNFAISITSWLWSFGYLGLKYPFDLFIYNTLDEENKNISKNSDYNVLPIPRVIVFDIGIQGVLQMTMAAFCASVQPAISLAISFCALLRFAIRSTYNNFMLQVLRINGRIPQTNTRLAWIVSGPGISKDYYNYLSIDDSLVLVECELEKLALLNRRKEVVEYLKDPIAKFNEFKKLFNFFHLDFIHSGNKRERNDTRNYNSEEKYDFGIEHSVKAYEETLFKQVKDKISGYPTTKEVRFTRAELQDLKQKACNFIESYVTERKMDFLWEKFKIAEGSWISLTEEILKSAFCNKILECLEENDLRVEVLKLGDGEDLEKSCLVEIKDSVNKKIKMRKNFIFSDLRLLNFYGEPFEIKPLDNYKI